MTLVFEEGHGITYTAGQYLTLVAPSGGEELRRSYSITSSPVLNEPLSIGVKRVENGALSRLLVDRARPGDEINTIGSGGFFVLPDDVAMLHQLVFFAAGSGITPMLSLIKTALHQFSQWSLLLIYSIAAIEKAVYLPALQELKRQFPERFRMELLFSNAPDLSKARLHRDLIFSYLQEAVTDSASTLFYICGPESYMRLCTYTLQEAGIPASAIKKENFYARTALRPEVHPPDNRTHTIIVRSGEQTSSFTVQHPDSILKAAKKAGLSLPYSCEAGRCGNCVARCFSGTVWHSYNEVLTEKELAQGLILTCVGHPVAGDVVLQF